MELNTLHGAVPLPAFFPDATYGAVRATDFESVARTGTPGLVMNAYHLYRRPGARLIKSLGGLHAFCGWERALLTDSGGFQLYSLIRENPANGEIRDNEIIFRPEGGERITFTPEKCIQAQLQYGSDVVMALDLCTHPDDPEDVQRLSVLRTIKWGVRCREVFDRLTRGKREKPMLFGIVQGGSHEGLRRECARELAQLGFEGFGFGGWPLNARGELLDDVLRFTAEAMPDGLTKYAMGLGRPEEIVRCHAMGYTLFDCVIPTREARHHRLYVFEPDMATRAGVRVPDGKFYRFHYALDEKHVRDASPIDAGCDCPLCARHSRAYLYHLLKMGDTQALRLMTLHNLRFYARLMECLR